MSLYSTKLYDLLIPLDSYIDEVSLLLESSLVLPKDTSLQSPPSQVAPLPTTSRSNASAAAKPAVVPDKKADAKKAPVPIYANYPKFAIRAKSHALPEAALNRRPSIPFIDNTETVDPNLENKDPSQTDSAEKTKKDKAKRLDSLKAIELARTTSLSPTMSKDIAQDLEDKLPETEPTVAPPEPDVDDADEV